VKLLVISHKETWSDPRSPSGFATIGGFPFQMRAISELFDQTNLLVLRRATEKPGGASPLLGYNLKVAILPEPQGHDLERKIRLLFWLPRFLPIIWKEVRQADAIHTPIPGDLGTIGMIIALLQKKPLFIRHCGRWGIPSSFMDRLLQWFLVRIASSKNVIMATGGGHQPPSEENKYIKWVFSTSLSENEFSNIPLAPAWEPGKTLKLVTVGSLLPGKNISALISALPIILDQYPDCELAVVGTGRLYEELLMETNQLGLEEHLHFHGNVSHERVMDILSSSHLFVFPTFYEGFPKALLEAMACGLPVIASPVSVIPHLVGDPNSGILLEGTDGQAVAKAVISMVSDPAAMHKMGENARAAAEGYTLEKWRDQIRGELESAWGVQLRKDV